jgi:hypothetical protein
VTIPVFLTLARIVSASSGLTTTQLMTSALIPSDDNSSAAISA